MGVDFIDICMYCKEEFLIYPFQPSICTNCLVSRLVITQCCKRKLCDNIFCKHCYYRSFLSHDKSIYIIGENPREISLGSNQNIHFDCSKCNHRFSSKLTNVTYNKRWCPYCTNQKLCMENCDICFKKSFASHEKAVYWSNKNTLKPREVLYLAEINLYSIVNAGMNLNHH